MQGFAKTMGRDERKYYGRICIADVPLCGGPKASSGDRLIAVSTPPTNKAALPKQQLWIGAKV